MEKKKKSPKNKIRLAIDIIILCVALFFAIKSIPEYKNLKPEEAPINPPDNVEIGTITHLDTGEITESDIDPTFSYYNIPEYKGEPSCYLNNNVPSFKDSDIERATSSFTELSGLDELGRCGKALASIGPESLATEERGSIQHVKPTGWHTIRYDELIKDKYLFNRCHLLGYQLTGILDDERNLITGTRYMNVEGMLPYENLIADYIRTMGNHVLYSVEPIFIREELVARGVHMQARSIEDNGQGVLFNIYCFNNQPQIIIDYATGDSWGEDGTQGTHGGY